MECLCEMQCHLKGFSFLGFFFSLSSGNQSLCDLLNSVWISCVAVSLYCPAFFFVWGLLSCLWDFAFSSVGVCCDFAVYKWQTISTVPSAHWSSVIRWVLAHCRVPQLHKGTQRICVSVCLWCTWATNENDLGHFLLAWQLFTWDSSIILLSVFHFYGTTKGIMMC